MMWKVMLLCCVAAALHPDMAAAQAMAAPVPGKCLAAGSTTSVLLRTADGRVLEFKGDAGGQEPVSIPNLANVVAVSAHGSKLWLALRSDGTVVQFKDGKSMVVPRISNAVDIASGYNHGVALLADGTVRTWGEKTSGVPGDNTCPVRPCEYFRASDREWIARNPSCSCPRLKAGERAPEIDVAKVVGIDNGIAIAAGDYQTFVITADGSIRAWGKDTDAGRGGALGVDAHTYANVPTRVPGVERAVFVTGGFGRGAALMADGEALSWGAYQGPGKASDIADALVPVPANMLRGAVALTPRLALRDDGNVIEWTRPGGTVYSTRLRDAVALASDGGIREGNVVLLRDGRLMKFGARQRFPNGPVEIGRVDAATVSACDVRALRASMLAKLTEQPAPQAGEQLDETPEVTAIVAQPSGGSCMALASGRIIIRRSDGRVMIGSLATGEASAVNGVSDVVAVAAGKEHFLALRANGSIYSMAGGAAARVRGINRATAIAAGAYHSVALLTDSTVKTWGRPEHAVLGDGIRTHRKLVEDPVRVVGLNRVKKISAAGYQTFAQDRETALWAWGSGVPRYMHEAAAEIWAPEHVSQHNSKTGYSFGTGVGRAWELLNEQVMVWDAKFVTLLDVEATAGVVAVSAGLLLNRDGTVEQWHQEQLKPYVHEAVYPVSALRDAVAVASDPYDAAWHAVLLANGDVVYWRRTTSPTPALRTLTNIGAASAAQCSMLQ